MVSFRNFREVSRVDLGKAIDACIDSSAVYNGTRDRSLKVLNNIHKGVYPAVGELIFNDSGDPSGWVYWYETAREGEWQSSTYLSPDLRGADLYSVLRCHQAHLAGALFQRFGPVVLLTSIDSENKRSLRAMMKYVERNNWGNKWVLSYNQETDRIYCRFYWPRALHHECHIFPEAA